MVQRVKVAEKEKTGLEVLFPSIKLLPFEFQSIMRVSLETFTLQVCIFRSIEGLYS